MLLTVVLQSAPVTKAVAAKADACALVADADVRRVLGVEVKERQPGTQEARGLLLSQCYLGTGTPRSVSVAVAGATRSGSKTVTPRAFWKQEFEGKEGKEGKDAKDAKE